MMGRAEEERDVPADTGDPVLVNGDFQKAPDGQPAGWYYVRQAKIEASGRTADGRCLTFQNTTPGRPAQALQAVGLDGRRAREIESPCGSAESGYKPVHSRGNTRAWL